MSYRIAIRENASGEIRIRDFEFDWHDSSLFWLSRGMGNFGCDCNRELEFIRAAGREPEWDETDCGHERFDILYAELPSGERIEIDGPSNPYWKD